MEGGERPCSNAATKLVAVGSIFFLSSSEGGSFIPRGARTHAHTWGFHLEYGVRVCGGGGGDDSAVVSIAVFAQGFAAQRENVISARSIRTYKMIPV